MNLLANPWVIIVALIASLALFGGGYWKGHHDADQSAQVDSLTASVQRRDATIKALREAKIKAEVEAARLEAIGRNFQKELADAKDETDRLRAAADAGSLRFTVHGICSDGMPSSAQSGPGNSGTVCTLTPKARRSYFDLREGIRATESKLRNCQDALRTVTAPAGGK